MIIIVHASLISHKKGSKPSYYLTLGISKVILFTYFVGNDIYYPQEKWINSITHMLPTVVTMGTQNISLQGREI